MCLTCWRKRCPERAPISVRNDHAQTCCWCKVETTRGIYIRVDPKKAPCAGKHPDEDPSLVPA